MSRRQRWNLIGLALVAVIVIFGQLIWLPGGLRFGEDLLWIDILDGLLYGLLAPPLIWFGAAAVRLERARSAPLHYLHVAVHFVILLCSVLLIAELLPMRRDWIRVAALFAFLAVLVLADLVLDDAVRERRVTFRTMGRTFAAIGIAALLMTPTAYDVTYPGLAVNMHRYAKAESGEAEGAILGLLVFQRPAVPVDWLYAALFPHYEFMRTEDRKLSQQLMEAQAMKTAANQTALEAAVARLGLEPGGLPAIGFHPYALHEGGPSHGAMLALAVIDQLTPGGVTNGWRVAGTGTIRSDGTIGPIGGIRQKAHTARKAGAEVFFVPAVQAQDVGRSADGMHLVAVNTLDDILQWLKQHEKPKEKAGGSR